MNYVTRVQSRDAMVSDKSGNDDILRSNASPEVDRSLCPVIRRKKRESGVISGAGGGSGTLSMREFFEAGGRSYEAYLNVKERRIPFPESSAKSIRTDVPFSTAKILQKLIDDRGQHPLVETSTRLPGSGTSDVGQASSPAPMTAVHYRMPAPENGAFRRAVQGAAQSQQPSATDTTKSEQSPTGNEPIPAKSPEVVVVKPSGQVCLTHEIIDRVIVASLKLPVADLGDASVTSGSQNDVTESVLKNEIAQSPAVISSAGQSTRSSSSPIQSVSPTSTTARDQHDPPPVCHSSLSPVESSSRPLTSNGRTKRRPSFHAHDSLAPVDLTYKRFKGVETDECQQTRDSEGSRDEQLPAEMKVEPIDRTTVGAGVVATSAILSDVTQWNVDQVVRYVSAVPGCKDYAEVFRQEEIDGACLIRLRERHLLDVIKMKLGPAIRLLQAISSLCVHTGVEPFW